MCADYYVENGKRGNDRATLVEMLQPARSERRARQPLRHIDCIWLNGELIPFDEATVHILNPTLHYGPGVFEGMGCYETARGPALFRPEAHLTRFLRRVRLMGVQDLRYDLVALRRAVHVTVQVNNFTSCYVRPILYFTGDVDQDSYEPAVAVTARGWDSDAAPEGASGAARRGGIRMMVSATSGQPELAEADREANGPAFRAMVARQAAHRAGFDEAILLDRHDAVADCTVEALFLLRDEVLYTPPQPELLPGVARDTVITLAGDLGYEVRQAPITRDQLYAADELFVSSTLAEVTPVREIDGRAVADGGVGPVTARLQQWYADTLRGRGRRSRGWLEYVMMEPLF